MADFVPSRPQTSFPTESQEMKGWFQQIWTFIRGITWVAASQTTTVNAKREMWFYPVDTTAGAVVVNLPPASGNLGKQYAVKRTAGANAVTLTPNGTDTIDGAATLAIGTTGDTAWVVSDGVNKWYKIKTF